MRLRRAVAHVDFVIGRFEQRLADRRRQALADDDRVALAVHEPFDADLLILVGNGRIGRAGDGDIGRKIGLARQRLGESEAGPRRRGFVIDLVVEDAEAVFFAHVLVDVARVFVVAPLQAGAIGVEGRAPHLVAGEEIAEQREGFRLLSGAAGALIGGVSRALAALKVIVAVVRLRVVRLGAEPGERQPRARVLRGACHRRAEERAGVLEFGGDDRGGGVLAQLLGALSLDLRADLGRFLAQCLGEPHDVAGEVFSHIGLDLGGEGAAGGDQQREREKVANGW